MTTQSRHMSRIISVTFLAILFFNLTTASVTPFSDSASNELDNPSFLWSRQLRQLELSRDGRCGNITKEGRNRRCPANGEEQAIIDGGRIGGEGRKFEMKCCSESGFCGGTAAHCGIGCQAGFGICSGSESDLTCGPLYNNRSCPQEDQCCSEHGFCGVGKAYCESPQCLMGFGKCDSSIIPAGRNTTWVNRKILPNIRIKVGGKEVGYGVNIFRCNNPGHVALTYDDGPYNYTGDLLDILDEFHFKATFFVTGVNKAKGPIDDPKYGWDKIIRRMYAQGHQIASHTWSHADLDELDEHDRRDEMIKLEMALRNIIGVIPTYMRPPFSSCTEKTGCLATMKALGYYIINFSLDTQDYFHTTPERIQISKDIFSQALSSENSTVAKDSHLVIAHDLHIQSAVNLTRHMVEVMRDGGWKGVTVGECLESGGEGQGEAGWYRIAENATERSERLGKEQEKGDQGGNPRPESTSKGIDVNGAAGFNSNLFSRLELLMVVVVASWLGLGI